MFSNRNGVAYGLFACHLIVRYYHSLWLIFCDILIVVIVAGLVVWLMW